MALAPQRGLYAPPTTARNRLDVHSTAFGESAVNEVLSKRMMKSQQMRWNRDTVQLSLTVRVAVLHYAHKSAFRSLCRVHTS